MTFKEMLDQDFIPAIEEMKIKEKKHLDFLVENNAPNDFIAMSMKHYVHFCQRLEEYKNYYLTIPD